MAPALATGPEFMTRPELRLLFAYGWWNRAAQEAAAGGTALAADGPFGDDLHGVNFGIQFETWW